MSIRAVRHSRVKDVFSGVKEPTTAYLPLPAYGSGSPGHYTSEATITAKNTRAPRRIDSTAVPVEQLAQSIFFLRGQRVIVDRQLAAIYGVETFDPTKP